MKKFKRTWSLLLTFVMLCAAVTFAPGAGFAAGVGGLAGDSEGFAEEGVTETGGLADISALAAGGEGMNLSAFAEASGSGLPDGQAANGSSAEDGDGPLDDPGEDYPSSGPPADPAADPPAPFDDPEAGDTPADQTGEPPAIPDGLGDPAEGAPGAGSAPGAPGGEGDEAAGGDGIAGGDVAEGDKTGEDGDGEGGMLAPLTAYVCEITSVGGGKFTDLGDALAAVDAAGPGSFTIIRLLDDIVYEKGIAVVGRTLLFDLNGKTLDVVNNVGGSGTGLSVRADSTYTAVVNFFDYAGGEFNVTGGATGVSVSGGGIAMVTNVTAGPSGGSTGIIANGSGSMVRVMGDVKAGRQGVLSTNGAGVYIRGDVSVFPGNTGYSAVEADSVPPSTLGGRVTIDGAITAPPGYSLIKTGGEEKAWNNDGGKPGYICYTPFTDPEFLSTSVVWVKDPASAFVCEIVGRQKFTTLDAALDAVEFDETIKLLENVSHDTDLIINNGWSFTLDLNGKTLAVDSAKNFWVENASEVFIEYNGGNIVYGGLLCASHNAKLHLPYVNGAFGLFCSTGGDITVNGDVVTTYSLYAVNADGGTVDIVGNIYANNIPKSGGFAVTARAGAVKVGGNITSSASGVSANSNIEVSEVTVGGVLTIPSGATYIYVDFAAKTKSKYTTPTTKDGYRTYEDTPAGSTVWVKDPGTAFVCEIAGPGVPEKYASVQGAIDAVSAGGTATIRMLKDYTQGSTGTDPAITVDAGKEIELDLNGKTLNAVGSQSSGLTVFSGSLKLLDPSNGAFNVTGKGVGVVVYAGCIAEMSNAKATSMSGPVSGVLADGGEIRVYGDVTAAKSGSGLGDTYGAASNGGKVTVDGKLNIPVGAKYIMVGGAERAPGDNISNSSKSGYLEYNKDSVSYVWVKDPYFNPVCEVVGGDTYDNVQGAIDAVPAGGSATIKMLANYTQFTSEAGAAAITVESNKKIMLDLNGKTLNAVSTSGRGLYGLSGSEIRILDHSNGAFNVTGNVSGVEMVGNALAEVSNVKASGGDSTVIGVNASPGKITVYGDVEATSTGTYTACGARVYATGTIEVFGNVTAIAAGSGDSYGVDATNGTSVTAHGDVLATSKGNGNGKAYGVYAYNQASATTTATAWGNVTATAAGSGDAYGVYAYGGGISNATAVAIAQGNVTATAAGGGDAYGVRAFCGSTGTAAATATAWGNVTATATGSGDVYGAYAVRSGTGNATTSVVGDVTVTATGGDAYGVRALDGGITAVGGDVTTTTEGIGNANGVYATDGGSAFIIGNVAKYGIGGYGAYASGSPGGKVTVEGAIIGATGTYYVFAGSAMAQGAGVKHSNWQEYFTYSNVPFNPGDSASNTVWVRDPDIVCIVVGTGLMYESVQDAIDAVPNDGTATITMLVNCDRTVTSGPALEVGFGKRIELNLNGKTLNAISTNNVGLYVEGGASLTLRKPIDGEFNVVGTVGVSANNNCVAEVTSIKALGAGYDTCGARSYGGQITVYGDVAEFAEGNFPAYGVRVDNNGVVEVSGNVTSSSEGYYKAYGVYAENNGTVEVSGDVTSSAEGGFDAFGVYAENNGTFEVHGDVSATATDNGDAYGAYAADNLTVTPVYVYGDVTAATDGGNAYGVHGVNITDGGVSVYGDVAATSGAGDAYGVYASDCIIGVDGDISAAAGSGNAYGAYAAVNSFGSIIYINGAIFVPAGSVYIYAKDAPMEQSEGIPYDSFPGYLVYSSDPADPSSPLSGTVGVKDPTASPVCENVDTGDLYYNMQEAITHIPSGGTATIRLLQNIDHRRDYSGYALQIYNKSVIFDLNGYRLNVANENPGGTGLDVNNGSVTLLEPYNGEFNVSGGVDGVRVQSNSRVEVTNVRATGTSTGSNGVAGVYASSESEVTVYGDLSVIQPGEGPTTMAPSAQGIRLSSNGAKVTVHGTINVPPGRTYVYIYGVLPSPALAKADHTAYSTKKGFLMYTSDFAHPNDPDVRTVWVRDPGAFAPVADISGVPDTITAGVALTLSGNVSPAYATNKAIVWTLVNPGATSARLEGKVLNTKAAGTVSVKAVIANGSGEGVAYTKTFVINVEPAPISLISLSPSYLMLYTGDLLAGAQLTASLAPESNEPGLYGKVAWSVTKADGSPSGDVKLSVTGGGKTAKVSLKDGSVPAQMLLITACYDQKYTATATVEVFTSEDISGSAKVLANKVTVNKAATVGALLPVFITNLDKSDFGLSAFSLGDPGETGALFIEKVELYYKTGGVWTDLPGYEARMSGADNRYIEIDALDGAKNRSSVRVMITPKGASEAVNAGTISLTVVTKYPKIKLTAGQLNLAWPTKTAPLTAASPDGACTIISASPAKAADKGKVLYDNEELKLGSMMTKKGSVSMSANVQVEGYKPLPANKWPKVTVKVVDTAPKVKLAKASVTLIPAPAGGAAKIALATANKKVPFESGYSVASVALSYTNAAGKSVKNPDVAVSYGGGVVSIQPKAGCKAGTALLKVSFTGSPKAVYLKLKVKMLDPGKKKTPLKATPGKSSLTVNVKHERGARIADIPIKLNAANIAFSDWAPSGWKAGVSDAIEMTAGSNKVTLSVKDSEALAALLGTKASKKYTLKIGSAALDALNAAPARTFSITLNVTKSSAIQKISKKGKIDIASPGSAITATVKLKGTTTEIESVRLEKTNAPGTPSKDFKSAGISGNTFRIEAAHKYVVPGVTQKLNAVVKFRNGQSLKKRIDVTPVQGALKTWQSRKAITLNRLTPLKGETIGLKLTKPKAVELGAIYLNQASLNALPLVTPDGSKAKSDGFKLVRAGENDYTIYFADGIAPWPKSGGNASKLKASYTIKVELWAEGTYTLGADGKPVALGYKKSNGKWVNKSKPVKVNIKVNIK